MRNSTSITATPINPEAIAREVHVNIALHTSFDLTNEELQALAHAGCDITSDTEIATAIGKAFSKDDNSLLELLENHGFDYTHCRVDVTLPVAAPEHAE